MGTGNYVIIITKSHSDDIDVRGPFTSIMEAENSLISNNYKKHGQTGQQWLRLLRGDDFFAPMVKRAIIKEVKKP